MKKFFFLLVFVIASMTASKAQPPMGGGQQMPEPKEMADRETQRMKKELVLTDEQTPKVAAINLKYAEQMKAAVEDAKEAGDFSTIRTKMEGIGMAKSNEITPLLTDEQKVKYEKMKKKVMREGQGGGMRRPASGGGNGMNRPGGNGGF